MSLTNAVPEVDNFCLKPCKHFGLEFEAETSKHSYTHAIDHCRDLSTKWAGHPTDEQVIMNNTYRMRQLKHLTDNLPCKAVPNNIPGVDVFCMRPCEHFGLPYEAEATYQAVTNVINHCRDRDKTKWAQHPIDFGVVMQHTYRINKIKRKLGDVMDFEK